MLPLYLLTAAKTKPVLIELKNGETLNGDLVNCDSWMNLTLKNVIQSSANGEEFMKIPEIYVRGIHIKYLRLPEEIMVHAKEQSMVTMEQRNRNQKRRGNQGQSQNRDNNFGGNRRGNFQGRGGYNNNNNRRYINGSQGSGSQGQNQGSAGQSGQGNYHNNPNSSDANRQAV